MDSNTMGRFVVAISVMLFISSICNIIQVKEHKSEYQVRTERVYNQADDVYTVTCRVFDGNMYAISVQKYSNFNPKFPIKERLEMCDAVDRFHKELVNKK